MNMTDCAHFERLMEGMLAGELEPATDGSFPRWAETARRELLAHVSSCPGCNEVYGFHEWLAREAPGLEEPEPSDLAAVRSRVLARIRKESPAARAEGLSGAGSSGTRFATWRRASSWIAAASPGLRLVLSGAAASLLVAAGVLLGRTTLPAGAAPGAGSAMTPGGMAGFEAEEIRTIDALPYALSNVSVEPAGAEQVRLSFDLTRRIRTTRSPEDPLVREALVQSLRGAAPLGDRLKALSLAGDLMDPGIRSALIDAMRKDASMAVRLRALDTLSRYPGDPDIQQAMLAVLADDESVQLRLLAIDYLGAGSVEPERIRTALDETQPDGAQALQVRASERLGL